MKSDLDKFSYKQFLQELAKLFSKYNVTITNPVGKKLKFRANDKDFKKQVKQFDRECGL